MLSTRKLPCAHSKTLLASSTLRPSTPQQYQLRQFCPTLHNGSRQQLCPPLQTITGFVNSCALRSKTLPASSKLPSAPQHWKLRQNCPPFHSTGGLVKTALRSTALEASSKLPSAPQHCRLCQNCPTLHFSGLVNSCALHSKLLLASSKLPCTPQRFWPRQNCPTFRKITGLAKTALHSTTITGLVKTALRFKSKTLSGVGVFFSASSTRAQRSKLVDCQRHQQQRPSSLSC